MRWSSNFNAVLTNCRINSLNGEGYGDRSFSYTCNKCGCVINHEMLRVAKFKRDAENLILNDWPFGGTILSMTGELGVASTRPKVLDLRKPVRFSPINTFYYWSLPNLITGMY